MENQLCVLSFVDKYNIQLRNIWLVWSLGGFSEPDARENPFQGRINQHDASLG